MHRNQRGFTLLEIIIALTLLSTAILALVQMFSGGLKQAAQADRYLNAVFLAEQKMAELELDSGALESQQGEFPDSVGYLWELKIEPYNRSANEGGSADQNPNTEGGAGFGLQKVALRVFWTENEQEKGVELVTLKTEGKTGFASPRQLMDSGSAAGSKSPSSPKTPPSSPKPPSSPNPLPPGAP